MTHTLTRRPYKKILDYDISSLVSIDYGYGNNSVIAVSRDAASGKFFINNPPEGKQQKDLTMLPDVFSKIAVSKYVQRSSTITTVPVVSHTLHFRGGETIVLSFLKSAEEKSNKYYLDVQVAVKENSDKNMLYIQAVTGKYIFALSTLDKKKYQRGIDDFFEVPAKATEQPADNATSITEPPEADIAALKNSKTIPQKEIRKKQKEKPVSNQPQ